MLDDTTRDPRAPAAEAAAVVLEEATAVAEVVRDHPGDGGREPGYRFEQGEAPSDGIRRIARYELNLTIDLLQSIPTPDETGEAVHEARKALKRLRALLRLSRGAIDEDCYRHENTILRDAGRALSGSRDAQVLLDTLAALRARYNEALREGTWSRLQTSLVAAATAPSGETVAAGSLLGILSDASGRVANWQLPSDGGPDLLADGLAGVYRRGRRAYRAASSSPSTESLHELRKRAKDLWHGAQLLEPIGAAQLKDLRQGAHRLSDLLGEDHDLTILREHAQARPELATEVELELLAALTSARQEALRREAMRCGAELYGERPEKLRRGLALA